MDWEYEDMIQMKPIRRRLFTYSPKDPLPYTDGDKQRQLHLGIGIGQRPLRFDISIENNREEWVNYYHTPVNFLVTLRYRIRFGRDTVYISESKPN